VAPGTEGAHALVALPATCTLSPLGSLDAPAVIETEAALSQALDCPAEVSAIDLTQEALLLVTCEMPPAQAGLDAMADETTVTFVSRQVEPCPDAPPPRPIQITRAFRLPRGAARSFRQASCTLPANCD
jgi:hypothetical protein